MFEQQAHFTIGTFNYRDIELADALADLIGAPTEYRQIQGLAGPNDIVQILADADVWFYLKGILVIYGTNIVAEAGKETWRDVVGPRVKAVPKKINRLYRSLKAAADNQGQTISIGLSDHTFCLDLRSDHVVLMDLSPEELTRHLYIFSHCAKSVSTWLSEVHKAQAQAGDVNATMRITDDGKLVVELRPCLNKPLPLGISKRVYDAQGNIVEEE